MTNRLPQLAAGAMLVWLLAGKPGLPHTDPLPPLIVPAGAPDMLTVFHSSPDTALAKEDCSLAGGLFGALAETIRYDGTLPQPRLTSGGHVEDLRIQARDFLLAGQSFATKYPAFAAAVGDYLTTAVGAESQTLDAGHRAKWVGAYEGLAAACEAARRKL